MANELLALKGKISYQFGFGEFYEMIDLYLEIKYHLVPIALWFLQCKESTVPCYNFCQVELSVFWGVVGWL